LTRALRDILGDALRGAGLAETSDIWQITQLWPRSVGSRIARRATPIGLARGDLTVAVGDAVWRQELALLGPEIVVKLNRDLGRDVVRRLRLVGDAGVVRESPPPSRRLAPRPSESGGADPRSSPPAPPPGAPPAIAAAIDRLAGARRSRLERDATSRPRRASDIPRAPRPQPAPRRAAKPAPER
jgi:hypothetical protein